MWELDHKESWVPKNWCFWTVILVKTLESPLDCKEIQPIHPKGISPTHSLEGLLLKLKLHYFGHLRWRTYSLKKTLMLDKIEGRRRKGWQNMPVGDHHQLNGHYFEQALGWWRTGKPVAAVHEVTKSQTQLNNWTELEKVYGGLKFKLLVARWNINKASALMFSKRNEFFFKLFIIKVLNVSSALCKVSHLLLRTTLHVNMMTPCC